ncbi:MAG: hypothetical protein R3A10_00495 [Caldilineaceae bacterium]
MPDPAGDAGAIVQPHAAAPAHGVWRPCSHVADAYRLPTPGGADGVQIVLYRWR